MAFHIGEPWWLVHEEKGREASEEISSNNYYFILFFGKKIKYQIYFFVKNKISTFYFGNFEIVKGLAGNTKIISILFTLSAFDPNSCLT